MKNDVQKNIAATKVDFVKEPSTSEAIPAPKELQAEIVYDEAAIRSRIVTTEGLEVDGEIKDKVRKALEQFADDLPDTSEEHIKFYVDKETTELRDLLRRVIDNVVKESDGDIEIDEDQIDTFLDGRIKLRTVEENGEANDLKLTAADISNKIIARKNVIYEDLQDSLDSAFRQYLYNGQDNADEFERPTPRFAYFDEEDDNKSQEENKAANRKKELAFKETLRVTLCAMYTTESGLDQNVARSINEFIADQVTPMSALEMEYGNPAEPKEHPILWFTHAEGLDENDARESRVANISEGKLTRAVLNLGVSEKKPRNEKEVTKRVKQDFSTSYLFGAADVSLQDLKEKLREKVVSAKLSFNGAFANAKTFFDPKKYTTEQEKKRKRKGIEGKEEREVIVIDLETVGNGDLNQFIDTLAEKLTAPEMDGFEGRYQFVITGSDDPRKKLSALQSETLPSNIVFTTGDNVQTTLESIEERYRVTNYMMSPTSTFFMDAKYKDPAIVNTIPESLFDGDKLDLERFRAVLDQQAPIEVQLGEGAENVQYTYADYVKDIEKIHAKSFEDYLKQENRKDAEAVQNFKLEHPDDSAGLKQRFREVKQNVRNRKVLLKDYQKALKYVRKAEKRGTHKYPNYNAQLNLVQRTEAGYLKETVQANSNAIGYAHWLSQSIRNDQEAYLGETKIAALERGPIFKQLFREDYPTALLQDGPKALTTKRKDIGFPNMRLLFRQAVFTGRHNPKARTADNEETRNSVPSVGRITSGSVGLTGAAVAVGLQAAGTGENFTKNLPLYFFAADNAIMSLTSMRTSQVRGNTSPEIARALSKAYIEGMRAVMKGLKSKKMSYDHDKVVMGGVMSMTNALIHLKRNGYIEKKNGTFILKRQNQKHNRKDGKNNFLTAVSSAVTVGTAVASIFADKIVGKANTIPGAQLSSTLNLVTGLTLVVNGFSILASFKDDMDRKVDFDAVASQIINGQQNDELTRILANNIDDIETIGGLFLQGASQGEIENSASAQRLNEVVEAHTKRTEQNDDTASLGTAATETSDADEGEEIGVTRIEEPEKYAVIIDTKGYSPEEVHQLETFFNNREDTTVHTIDNPAVLEDTDIWNNGKTERAILFTQDSIFMGQYHLKPGMPQITTNISFAANGDEDRIGHLNYTDVSTFTQDYDGYSSHQLFEHLKSKKIQIAEQRGLQVVADNMLNEFETTDQLVLYSKTKIQSILKDDSKTDFEKRQAIQLLVALVPYHLKSELGQLDAYSKIAADVIVNGYNKQKETGLHKLARSINRGSIKRRNADLKFLEEISGLKLSYKSLKESIRAYNPRHKTAMLSPTQFKASNKELLEDLDTSKSPDEVLDPRLRDIKDLEKSAQEGGQELLQSLVEFSNKLHALYFRTERKGGTDAEARERANIDNSDTKVNAAGAIAVGVTQSGLAAAGLATGENPILQGLFNTLPVGVGIFANFIQVRTHLENKKKNTNFDFDRAFADIYGKIYQKALTTSGDSDIATKVATKATANLAYKSLISVENMLRYADKQKKITEWSFYASIASAVVSTAGGFVGNGYMQNTGLAGSLSLATAANANAAFNSDAPIRSFSAALGDDLTNVGFNAQSKPFADFVKTLVKQELVTQGKKVPFTPDDVALNKTSLDQNRYDRLVAYRNGSSLTERIAQLVQNVVDAYATDSLATDIEKSEAKTQLGEAIGVAPYFIGANGQINRHGLRAIDAMEKSFQQYESNKSSLLAALRIVKENQGAPASELYERIAETSVQELSRNREGVVSSELDRISKLPVDVRGITDADGTINHIVTVYDNITGGPAPGAAQDLKNGFQKGVQHARYKSYYESKVAIQEDSTLPSDQKARALDALKQEFSEKVNSLEDLGESTLTILTGSAPDRAEKANLHLLAASADTNTMAFCENGAELMVSGETPYKDAFQFLPEIPEDLKAEAKRKLDTIRDVLDEKIKKAYGDDAIEVPGKGISGIYLEPGKQHGMTVHFTNVQAMYPKSMVAIEEAYDAVLDLFQKLTAKYEASELFVVKKSADWVEMSSASKKLIQPLLDNINKEFPIDVHNLPRITTYSGDSGSDQDGMRAIKEMVATENETIDAHNAANPSDRIPRSHTLIMGVLNQSPIMRDRPLNKPDGASYADFFVLGGPDHHAHILGNHELTHKLTELKTIFIHHDVIQTEDKQGKEIKQCKKPVQIVDDKGLTLIVNFDKLGNSLGKLKNVLDDIKDNPYFQGREEAPKIVIRDCNLNQDRISGALGDEYLNDVFFLRKNQVYQVNGDLLQQTLNYERPYLPFRTQSTDDQTNIFDPLNQEMDALYQCSDTFEPHRRFYENRHQYLSENTELRLHQGEVPDPPRSYNEEQLTEGRWQSSKAGDLLSNPHVVQAVRQADQNAREPILLVKDSNLNSISQQAARQSAMRDYPRVQEVAAGAAASTGMTPDSIDGPGNSVSEEHPAYELKGFLPPFENEDPLSVTDELYPDFRIKMSEQDDKLALTHADQGHPHMPGERTVASISDYDTPAASVPTIEIDESSRNSSISDLGESPLGKKGSGIKEPKKKKQPSFNEILEGLLQRREAKQEESHSDGREKLIDFLRQVSSQNLDPKATRKEIKRNDTLSDEQKTYLKKRLKLGKSKKGSLKRAKSEIAPASPKMEQTRNPNPSIASVRTHARKDAMQPGDAERMKTSDEAKSVTSSTPELAGLSRASGPSTSSTFADSRKRRPNTRKGRTREDVQKHSEELRQELSHLKRLNKQKSHKELREQLSYYTERHRELTKQKSEGATTATPSTSRPTPPATDLAEITRAGNEDRRRSRRSRSTTIPKSDLRRRNDKKRSPSPSRK